MGNSIEKGHGAPFPVDQNNLDFLVDVGRVRFNVSLHFEVLDIAVWTYQNPNARGIARVGTLASTICKTHGPLGVAKKRKIEGKLLSEVLIFFNGIEAYAQNLCVFLLKFIVDVAEPATLDGSSRGVSFGIKPQNDVFSSEVAEAYGVPVVIADAEIRRFIARLKHLALLWLRHNYGSGHGAEPRKIAKVESIIRA